MGTQATKSYQAGKENPHAVAEQTHAENKPGPGETKPPRDILLSLTWAPKKKAFAVRFLGPVLMRGLLGTSASRLLTHSSSFGMRFKNEDPC